MGHLACRGRTRKLLTNNRSFHPQADIDRLYIRRKHGGRGLLCVEDSVHAKMRAFIIMCLSDGEEMALMVATPKHTLN